MLSGERGTRGEPGGAQQQAASLAPRGPERDGSLLKATQHVVRAGAAGLSLTLAWAPLLRGASMSSSVGPAWKAWRG